MRSFFLLIQILCLVGGFTTTYAQNYPRLSTRVEQASAYYSRQSARVERAETYTVRPDEAFTSVSLRIDGNATFDGAYVIHRQDTFYLRADEHRSPDISYQQSSLVVFDEPVEELLFYPATLRGDVAFSFFDAQGEKKSRNPSRRTRSAPAQASARATAACDEPAFVPADAWRAGLPPPSYSRTITSVEHVIVHHSATYNDLTNYENVVRNIYLFHTQERKWSDIGYNYLIAQDGTVFEGRSAGSSAQENDDVQGAHFCGQNGGTLGVCLLGDYTTAEPTDTTLASLVKLTAWKVAKEGLDPEGERPHPANATLPTIAGHRDGCATQCPGDNVYVRLGEIRDSVEEYILGDCSEAPGAVVMYPVPTAGTLTIALPDTRRVETVAVYDMAGRTWNVRIAGESERPRTLTLSTGVLAAGVYVLHLGGAGWEAQRKILIE